MSELSLEDLRKARKYIDGIEQPFWDSITDKIKEIQSVFYSKGIIDANEIGTIMGIIIKRSDENV